MGRFQAGIGSLGTADCEACSGYLSRFERCCGEAVNPPEMPGNVSDCPKKQRLVESGSGVGKQEVTGDR